MRRRLRSLPDETFRVRGVSNVERLLTAIADLFGTLAVDDLADPRS
jgi:hypothetical protein